MVHALGIKMMVQNNWMNALSLLGHRLNKERN